MTPFPLDGGRAGDGGGFHRDKPQHAPGGVKRARHLRRESTYGERELWKELRKLNANFRRQTPIGRYIVDFVRHESKLIVEIDGPHHDDPERRLRDGERTAWLETQGFRVLRFSHNDLAGGAEAVVRVILALVNVPPPSQTLPPSRGKGFEAA